MTNNCNDKFITIASSSDVKCDSPSSKIASTSSPDILSDNEDIFQLIDKNDNKGLLIGVGYEHIGVWYYYNHKLIRFYRDIKNETSIICSIDNFMRGADMWFIMENGNSVKLSYKNNMIRVHINENRCTSYKVNSEGFKWIAPLSVRQVLIFSLDQSPIK